MEGRSEARSPTEGGPGPPDIFKKLDCKWCNQSYSGAVFVDKKQNLILNFLESGATPICPEQLAAMLQLRGHNSVDINTESLELSYHHDCNIRQCL